jgi:CTP synthase
MQLMVVDFGREVLGTDNVNSSEFDRTTQHPVIDLMLEQQDVTDMGGTMRLGLYPCNLQPGTIARKAYGVDKVDERHRHRFEFNNTYREQFAKNGMKFSGLSPNGNLVEIAELDNHPFMLGTQFHPEFLSRPTRPHPLFVEFVRAACEKAGIPTEEPPLSFDE